MHNDEAREHEKEIDAQAAVMQERVNGTVPVKCISSLRSVSDDDRKRGEATADLKRQ